MNIHFKLDELLDFLIEKKLYHPDIIDKTAKETVIKGFSSIFHSKPFTLSWMKDQSFDWSTIQSSVVICARNAVLPENTGIIFIPVENPRDTFAIVMNKFYPQNSLLGISETAVIGENCELGNNIYIGHHVVIGNNVKIGDNTQIHHNATIHDSTSIGSNCIIHSGVVIGEDGFGYHNDTDGSIFKLPHIARVIIEDYVEVGTNSCIVKGKLIDTVIKSNVKIGNLSHISHDVIIDENAMITHLTHIGGNTKINSHSWIAPGVVLKQGVSIGENALVGMGAVVIRDVNPNETAAGVPAKPITRKSPNA
ncbi:UDP-3-O-(3-hydroxymyristoyl)glucosamine N-acyltransferase [Bacillus sp. FJAT-49705]|uniref:UDP-3-O-(3-hydroxymyristoyl)glucosamine N-acyltransferase n=1 Tax=Cytobacillus citreus TaxID=2833586 RepID=A0ABS5P033_9BACI|nr:UDP-3-O-(3-hydroxymyristoyl)glucosamine N-acyltransferase [Cytobacillus citreus]MBS4192708.1 UDP-3-O-(3-hydroxymyristoyl)glucosamine N-acyltransferase [Cytobacillus citreus]